ncbi:Transcription factor [Niveomyces insectorum RCEF 264]|uniref:Transcription factor n=1 Tax=Niveomyces insectorum RCEF 264 TaxID=1081102 RepID=A0A162MDD4_9HYPO|nr:Transcription factor [Niveomyces insectorum RCEF 264]
MLADQLKQCEALLREKGVDTSKLRQRNAPVAGARPRSRHSEAVVSTEFRFQLPPTGVSEPSPSRDEAQAVHGPARVRFTNVLWASVVEEGALEEEFVNDAGDDETLYDGDCDFVLVNQPTPSSESVHPPPAVIRQLWCIFRENVDPLTKIVHVPTVGPAVERAASNIAAVPRAFEALLFAMYSAAVMSLKDDDECTQRLGEPRHVLLTRYVAATKAALARVRFMGTTNFVVLQALLIHLIAVRATSEPRALWSLTGTAVRIAEGMGLDRDGTHLGLSPFETEMRRRVWWQLKMNDFQVAELCGRPKFHDLHTGGAATKWPSNIDDDQLHPAMEWDVLLPTQTEQKRATDAVFLSLKCEFLKLAAERVATLRRARAASDPWDLYTPQEGGNDAANMEGSFCDAEERLESRYLRYCDPSQPLHLMAMLMARCAISILRFMAHHPRRWTNGAPSPVSERERQWVWNVCLQILDRQNMLQSSPHLRQFAWYAPHCRQWHAIIHVLDTLRAEEPLAADADRAWSLVARTYENNPDMTLDMRKPIHVAVANLCLQAYSKYEAAVESGRLTSSSLSSVRPVAERLRHQREAARAKKQKQQENRKTLSTVTTGATRANMPGNDLIPAPGQETGVSSSCNTLQHAQQLELPTQMTSADIPFSRPSAAMDKDVFWFSYGLDTSYANDTAAAGMDVDVLLGQGSSIGDDATNMVSWDQWDSWVMGSSTTRGQDSREDFATIGFLG